MTTPTDYVAITWSLTSITFLLLMGRLYSRVYLRRRWTWSDALVVIAWLHSLVYASIVTVEWKMPAWVPNPEFDWPKYMKLEYASKPIQMNTVYFVKLSMLCLYLDFVCPQMRKTSLAIKIVFGIVIACCLATTLFLLFSCQPISTFWTLDDAFDGVVCWWFHDRRRWLIPGIQQIVTDIIVWCIPFAVVPKLNPTQRTVAIVMFSLGFISISTSLISNILVIYFRIQTDYVVFGLVYVSKSFEVSTAVAMACVPGCRGLWRAGIVPWRNIAGGVGCCGKKERGEQLDDIENGTWTTRGANSTGFTESILHKPDDDDPKLPSATEEDAGRNGLSTSSVSNT